MDIRQSDHYLKFMESIGWIVERVGTTNIFIRKIGPTSVIKIQRPEKLNLGGIEKIVRKYHPLLIKIEPNTKYRIQNTEYSPDNWPLLPTKTLLLNLNMDLNFLPKDTRYEIRKSMNISLSLRKSNDTELFYELLEETMKIGGWSVPIKKEVVNLYKSFQPNNSVILMVSTVNREPDSTVNIPVAACLLIWDKDTAHYMYAALTQKGRELGAAYFLLWEAIQFLQEKKLKYLDLEGIYDERYPKQTKHWQGFTKFKMAWGGQVVQYPGSFVKYANPIIAWLFKLTT